MFSLDCVNLTLNCNEILKDISFTLEPGKMHILVGPNGAGKSSLLKIITGELPATSGGAFYNGLPIANETPEYLATLRAVLPQISHLSFPFTVFEVAAMGIGAQNPARRQQKRVLAALDRVGMSDFAGRFYQQLSGGEQHRVQLARVLAQIGEPVQNGVARYLFLDEPISNLDISQQQRILEITREFATEGGGVLIILHDINIAARYADQLIILADGRIKISGPPSEILTRNTLEQVWQVGIAALHVPGRELPLFLPESFAGVELRKT